MGRWISRDPIGKKGGANLYEYVLNNPIYLIDLLGLDVWTQLDEAEYIENAILYGSRAQEGVPDGEPWVEHPTYNVSYYDKVATQSALEKLLWGKARKVSTNWTVDYLVAGSITINVVIAGPDTAGKPESSDLLKLRFSDRLLSLDSSIIDQMYKAIGNKLRIRCAKKVLCHTKCACGENSWEMIWKPKKKSSNYDDRYLYGYVEAQNFGTQLYCKLDDREKERKKTICTKDRARQACKEVP